MNNPLQTAIQRRMRFRVPALLCGLTMAVSAHDSALAFDVGQPAPSLTTAAGSAAVSAPEPGSVPSPPPIPPSPESPPVPPPPPAAGPAPLPGLPPVEPGSTTPVPVPPPPAAPTPPPAGPADPSAPPQGPPAPQDIMPADFLAIVGQQTKARWRQLYREQTPSPTTSQRLRVAFVLGSLQGDAYLALQAGDAQRFRDNNQDVLNLCRVLGIAEKMKPDLLAEAKMAETEDWATLRTHIPLTHKLTETLLHDQRDEDLAILVNLGMWMRLFEVATTLVVNDTEVANKSLCVGSVPLLNELMARYGRLTESSRKDPSVILVGNVLQMLQRHWSTANETPPPQQTIQMTFEKLRFIMEKMK